MPPPSPNEIRVSGISRAVTGDLGRRRGAPKARWVLRALLWAVGATCVCLLAAGRGGVPAGLGLGLALAVALSAADFVRAGIGTGKVARERANPDKKIYVLCPAHAVTGGPEALHQFVHVARSLGFDAALAYEPAASSVPKDYRRYDVRVAESVPDDPEAVVVAPEVYPWVIDRFPRATKIFWWLSWDHGAAHWEAIRNAEMIHACQSRYAFAMLRERLGGGRSPVMLSDFTRHPVSGVASPAENVLPRENLVVYNPAKGMEFMSRVIEANPDLVFKPIEKMSSKQVRALLLSAKVYVDFGPHPGKDRIPREAAACGCCVVTAGDRGASAFFEDLPIPSRYKFATRAFDPAAVGTVIRDCLEHDEARRRDFDPFRERIGREAALFSAEVWQVLRLAGCTLPS